MNVKVNTIVELNKEVSMRTEEHIDEEVGLYPVESSSEEEEHSDHHVDATPRALRQDRFRAFFGNAYCYGMRMSALAGFLVFLFLLLWHAIHDDSIHDLGESGMSWAADDEWGKLAVFVSTGMALVCVVASLHRSRDVGIGIFAEARTNAVNFHSLVGTAGHPFAAAGVGDTYGSQGHTPPNASNVSEALSIN